MRSLSQLKRLRELDIKNTSVTDLGLSSICKISGLQELSIEGTNITPEGYEHLRNLRHLNLLDIEEDLAHREKYVGLPAIKNIEHLEYRNLGIGDEGLKAIGQIQGLKSLLIRCLNSPSGITPQGFRHLCNLGKLIKIDLVRVNIGDKGLEYLSNIKSLEELELKLINNISDEGLKSITKMVNLHELDMRVIPNITDQGLMELTSLTKLYSLWIRGCESITEKGIESFKLIRPDVHVHWCDHTSHMEKRDFH